MRTAEVDQLQERIRVPCEPHGRTTEVVVPELELHSMDPWVVVDEQAHACL